MNVSKGDFIDMEDKMIERLEAILVRVDDIDKLLCEDSIVSDVAKLTSLNKERANLSEPYEAYLKYKKMMADLKDAEIMAGDSDPEISEFAKESIVKLEEQLEAMKLIFSRATYLECILVMPKLKDGNCKY
jgi:peptide chain release factor 1